MTEVYLALGGAARNLKSSLRAQPAPSLLLSFIYYKSMEEIIQTSVYRYWVLDSGAFTAFQQGKPIVLDEYIEFCRKVMLGPTPPKEIYALDVIGDWQASAHNTELMWKAGIKAIPTFHIDEPDVALKDMAARYPKIAFGGVAGMGARALPWLKQCFARVWPKPVHAFGIHSEDVLMSLPFHSADATNWQLAPTCFGRWSSYGGAKLAVRSHFHLRPQVDKFLDFERKLKAKWSCALRETEIP